MLRSKFTIATVGALVAILYVGLSPLLFGLLSEITLPHWFVDVFMSERKAHRVWSDISALVSILSLGTATALFLDRVMGRNALRVAIVVGAVSISVFALMQLAGTMPVRLRPEFQVRAWVINIARAMIVPAIILIFGSSNKLLKERRGESHAL